MPVTHATGIGPVPTAAPKLAPNVLDLFSLKGKVASVTGASSGIGKEVAIAYAQAGADVALWYNGNPKAVETAAMLEKEYGVRAKAYKCPITDSAAVEATTAQIVKDFGRLDVQVVNAGVAWEAGPMIDVEGHDEWKKVIDIDLNGAYYAAKAAGRVFKSQGTGSLIFTASMSGHIVNIPQMQACYNAAKAGLLHLSRSLAVEWAGFARSNTVSPGYMITEISNFAPKDTKQKWQQLIPLGREGNPRELVGAYLYFASDASTYTTGADLIVDGGYCAP
ncbi:uncharacterized protein V1510DRAFT_414279 [Dipodascopsis tothii]|uniref:uncharacterized protein n=1 Tax=Dipodascopsis tothii TaxID=44089 RepID=UPI0034CFA53A